MKKVFNAIIFLFILILLAVTNPQKTDYVNWVVERAASQSQDVLSKSIIGLLGKPIIEQSTVKNDYILFSVYSTNVDGNETKAIGVLKNFINLPTFIENSQLLFGIIMIVIIITTGCLFLYLLSSKNTEA